MFKIVQKKNPLCVYALFDNRERAELWLKHHYDPKAWMDKDVTAEDLEIVEVV